MGTVTPHEVVCTAGGGGGPGRSSWPRGFRSGAGCLTVRAISEIVSLCLSSLLKWKSPRIMYFWPYRERGTCFAKRCGQPTRTPSPVTATPAESHLVSLSRALALKLFGAYGYLPRARGPGTGSGRAFLCLPCGRCGVRLKGRQHASLPPQVGTHPVSTQ